MTAHTQRRRAGHGFAPHTADCIIRAWGPDRASCLTEALLALVEGFASASESSGTGVVPIGVGPGPPEEQLVGLLEQVIFTADASSVVPMHFDLGEREDGGIAGTMDVVPASETVAAGPLPKGVSYHGLSMVERGGIWRCRVLVDV